jgi:2-(1,2-epoxy-1,2-dihydrophenyl)acetyl-CoA isomerase
VSTAPFPQDDHLHAELDSGVLTVTMTNPKRRNSLNDDAVASFISVVQRAQNDEDVRALLIVGDGGDFCSGFDIIGRNSGDGPKPRVGAIQRRLPSQAHRLIPLLVELQVPIIAAVRGYAAGIGLQLLLTADFVVTAEDAILWEPFAQRGMAPDSGATWLLPRVVGPRRAKEMLMLGKRLSGAEAVEWGIAYESLPGDEVLERGRQLAAAVAAGPTVTLGITRWLLNTSPERDLKEQLAQEGFAMEIASRSQDFREGLKAFMEKRDPEFGGR